MRNPAEALHRGQWRGRCARKGDGRAEARSDERLQLKMHFGSARAEHGRQRAERGPEVGPEV